MDLSCRAKQQAAAAAGSVVSPITGELIPLAQMQEHMRISLIDPKWKQQRDTMLSKIRETTKASDDEIGRNLLGLARHRPDVFGEQCFLLAAAPYLLLWTGCLTDCFCGKVEACMNSAP